jgi:hypothetical protein
MQFQTCRRHPSAGRFLATCSGCAQELYDIEQANRAEAEALLVAKVGQALGFRSGWKPNTYLGETATRITAWTQVELNTVFERVGGTVTTRQVERSTSDGSATWTATEITLTVHLPGIASVEVSTDWDEETGGRDLPVMRAVPDANLIAA